MPKKEELLKQVSIEGNGKQGIKLTIPKETLAGKIDLKPYITVEDLFMYLGTKESVERITAGKNDDEETEVE